MDVIVALTQPITAHSTCAAEQCVYTVGLNLLWHDSNCGRVNSSPPESKPVDNFLSIGDLSADAVYKNPWDWERLREPRCVVSNESDD